MVLSLDADVLIQAQRYRFPFDLAPGFWEALESAGEAGNVVVVDSVYREITKTSKDELAVWLKERKEIFRTEDRDSGTQAAMGHLGKKIDSRRPAYTSTAKEDFFGKADSWIVAHAMSQTVVVVTEEARAPKAYTKVKIPDACELVGVRCINTLELLRTMNLKLVRG